MPKFLENKLKAEYPNNAHAVYGTMNKIGAMHGNKETAKGRAMERKHQRDAKSGAAGRSHEPRSASTSSHIDHAHHNVKNAKGHSEKLRHA